MLNKEFFVVDDKDFETFTKSIDLYKESVIEVISLNPSMTVKNYSDWMDNISDTADNILTKYSFLFMANQLPEVMDSYNNMIKYVKEKTSDLDYSYDYYNFIKSLIVEDEQDKILKDKMIKSFNDRGLELPKEKQARLIEISKELSDSTVKFLKNISDARKDWVFEISLDSYNELSEQHKKYFTDLKMDWNINKISDLLGNCDNEDLRKRLSDKNKIIANKNTEFDNSHIIENIVLLKKERAEILGKTSVAELVLEDAMAKDIHSATGFLTELCDRMLPFAIKENNDLYSFVDEKYGVKNIENHSMLYYSNKMKEHLFSYTNDEERKYFTLENSLNGTFNLIEKMFGITFEKVENGFNLPFEDGLTYKVFNEGKDKGYVILDLYERKMKKSGAWVANHIAPTQDKKGLLSLTTNFSKDKEGLSFTDLTTLLHEFGHLVHGVSSQTKYRSYSGTNGLPRDAVEIPSQMLEKFALNEDFLKDISKNKIPEDLITKSKSMKNFRSANFYTRQIGMAAYDLDVYKGTKDDIIGLYKKNMDKANPTPVDEDSNFPMVFAHIFSGGYSAGYYGYLWSDVYSVDAFSFINQNKEKLGKEYKDKVLSEGNARPAKDLYLSFRGGDADISNFLSFYGLNEQPKRKLKM